MVEGVFTHRVSVVMLEIVFLCDRFENSCIWWVSFTLNSVKARTAARPLGRWRLCGCDFSRRPLKPT